MIEALLGSSIVRYALFGAVLAAVGFYGGMKVEHNSNAEAWRKVEQEAHEQYKKDVEKQRSIAAKLSKELAHERMQRAEQSSKYQEERRRSREAGIALATCQSKEGPATMLADNGAPAAAPVPRFSAEFARLHDLAYGAAGVPGAGNTARANGAPAAAGTVDAETVLDVSGQNAFNEQTCRARYAKWQALARENGWVK